MTFFFPLLGGFGEKEKWDTSLWQRKLVQGRMKVNYKSPLFPREGQRLSRCDSTSGSIQRDINTRLQINKSNAAPWHKCASSIFV